MAIAGYGIGTLQRNACWGIPRMRFLAGPAMRSSGEKLWEVFKYALPCVRYPNVFERGRGYATSMFKPRRKQGE